ncbi:MAG: Nif3-like dinuclear metal center hexameric protein [Flavobacteriales bacterium]
MKLSELIQSLETFAPPALQEGYDNSGLIVGDPEMTITSAIICLDSTPDVIDEAIRKGSNLVIAHHPIVFSGLKKITGRTYIERTLLAAIKHDIAIYAIHTNLDNVYEGVNKRIADKIGLIKTKILEPKKGQLSKLTVFVPEKNAETVRQAIFDAGAGSIGNYSECSFNSTGQGTFKAGENARPHIGEIGRRHTESEIRIEAVLPVWKSSNVIKAMKSAHPYEEVAFDLVALQNDLHTVGSGLIGDLKEPESTMDFLNRLKKDMQTSCVRYTRPHLETVSRIAVCGGSGSFLLEKAIRAGADVLVTSDFKYHQFFDADGQIIIADIGHFESEQFTIDLLGDWLRLKFPTFALHFTDCNTNPVNYL